MIFVSWYNLREMIWMKNIYNIYQTRSAQFFYTIRLYAASILWHLTLRISKTIMRYLISRHYAVRYCAADIYSIFGQVQRTTTHATSIPKLSSGAYLFDSRWTKLFWVVNDIILYVKNTPPSQTGQSFTGFIRSRLPVEVTLSLGHCGKL